MNRRHLVAAVVSLGIAAVLSGGFVIFGAAGPSSAFTGTCPTTTPPATLVADNVCEVRITTVGSSPFTPPNGVTKLAAVLVGGGGGSGSVFADHFYGGSGGSVVYVDNLLPVSGAINVVIGAGGAASTDGESGGDTTVTTVGTTTASGGLGGAAGEAASGLFCIQDIYPVSSGDGASSGRTGPNDCLPGAGYSLSAIPGVDATLFPAAADGSDTYRSGGIGTAAFFTYSFDPVAGSGGAVDQEDTVAGANGLVVFRFAPVAVSDSSTSAPSASPSVPVGPALAATGTVLPWGVPAASVAAIALGVLLLAYRRRVTFAR